LIQTPVYVSDDSSAVIDINYTIYDTFTSNTFTAYLSDETGDFTSELNIGQLDSDSTGSITGTIPAGTVTGTDYQIKVKSTNPVKESSLSNKFEIILDNDAPSVTISSTESTSTSADPIPVTISFNEDVTGFILEDVVVDNGTISSFDGSTAPTYSIEITPSSSGAITVDVPAGVARDVVGNENEAATPWTIEYYPTNIEMLKEYGVSIYPNPSNGKFRVDIADYNVKQISIFDLSGRLILKEDVSKKSTAEFNLKNMASGIYLFKIDMEGKELSSKIIIE
jgi:hypothetical protein